MQDRKGEGHGPPFFIFNLYLPRGGAKDFLATVSRHVMRACIRRESLYERFA